MNLLKNYIQETYGSVYRAAKELNRTESQLHRWIKLGAVVIDGEVFVSKGKL